MLTQTDVTIWHKGYDKQTRMDTDTLLFSGRASCQADMVVSVSDGLEAADVIRLRIPTEEAIGLANGDRLVLAASSEASPPEDAFTIIHFADNRKGTRAMWHYKVVAQG